MQRKKPRTPGRIAPMVPILAVALAAAPLTGQTSGAPPGEARIVVGGIGPGGLVVLEGSDRSPVARIDSLEQVHGAAISPEGDLAYALNMVDSDRAVTVVDVEAGSVLRSVALPGPGHHAVASPLDGRVYVAYGTMGLDPERPRGVAVLSARGDEVETLGTEGTPYYVTLAPGGSRLYVAVQHPNRLLVIDLPDLRPKAELELGGPPGHMAVAGTGAALFATIGGDAVVRVDLKDLVIDGRVAAGPDAHAVALAGTPPLLYVGNRSPGTVSVMEPVTLEVMTTRFVAPMLTHLLALPDRSLLASAGGTREVLRLAPRSLSVLHRTSLPFQPHQSAVSRRTGMSGSSTDEGGPR